MIIEFNFGQDDWQCCALSFTAAGAHYFNPTIHLLTTYYNYYSKSLPTKGRTTSIPKKGIPKLSSVLRTTVVPLYVLAQHTTARGF